MPEDRGAFRLPVQPEGMRWDLADYGPQPNLCKLLLNATFNEGAYVPRPLFQQSLTTSTYNDTADWLHRYQAGVTERLVLVTAGEDVVSITSANAVTSVHTGAGSVTESVGFNVNSLLVYTLYPAAAPRSWDGSTDAAPSFTLPIAGDWSALTTSDIAGGFPFKSRVYYWSPKTNELLYTALLATAGTVTRFPTENVSRTGGGILWCSSLTQDGGDGPDDLFVIGLNTGEDLIYQGSDPASDWEIIGRFEIPPPLNANCVCRLGGDLLTLTRKGLYPVQQYIKDQMSQVTAGWLRAVNPYIERYFTWVDTFGTPNGRLRFSKNSNRLMVHLRGGTSGVLLIYDFRNGTWSVNAVGPKINDADEDWTTEARYFMVCDEATVANRDSCDFNNTVYIATSGSTIRLAKFGNTQLDGKDFDEQPIKCVWETAFVTSDKDVKLDHGRVVGFVYDTQNNTVSAWSLWKQSDTEAAMIQQQSGATSFHRQWDGMAGLDQASRFQLRWNCATVGSASSPYSTQGIQVFGLEMTVGAKLMGP